MLGSSYVPTIEQILSLLQIFAVDDGFLTGLSFPGLTSQKEMVDFCWGLKLKHWQIHFERDYFSYVVRREQLPRALAPDVTDVRTYDDGFVADGGSVRGTVNYATSELQSCKVCDTI